MSKQKRPTKKPAIATTTTRPTVARVVPTPAAPKNPTASRPTNPRPAKSLPTTPKPDAVARTITPPATASKTPTGPVADKPTTTPISRPVPPPPAPPTPISRPLATSTRANMPPAPKSPPAPPLVRPKVAPAPRIIEAPASNIKQHSELALPTKGQIARLMSAITRAFPYVGIEYVVFLALIEYNPTAAWVMGILAVVGGIGLAGLRVMRPNSQPAPAWEQMVVGWFGQVYCIAASVAAFGLGLLAWSRWHATNSAFFSGVSVVALIAALLLLVAASYLRQEA